MAKQKPEDATSITLSPEDIRPIYLQVTARFKAAIAEGRLARGQNPVLITFELVIEVQEMAPRAGSHS